MVTASDLIEVVPKQLRVCLVAAIGAVVHVHEFELHKNIIIILILYKLLFQNGMELERRVIWALRRERWPLRQIL